MWKTKLRKGQRLTYIVTKNHKYCYRRRFQTNTVIIGQQDAYQIRQNCSQQSFITRDLAKQSGLNIDHDNLPIGGVNLIRVPLKRGRKLKLNYCTTILSQMFIF